MFRASDNGWEDAGRAVLSMKTTPRLQSLRTSQKEDGEQTVLSIKTTVCLQSLVATDRLDIMNVWSKLPQDVPGPIEEAFPLPGHKSLGEGRQVRVQAGYYFASD